MSPPLSAPPIVRTSPLSTGLKTVLSDLGHRCAGDCGSAGDELQARVWFTRRLTSDDSRPCSALVVIDVQNYTGALLRWIQLLRQVNACTAADGIRVIPRRSGDAGRALAAAQASRRDLT